MHAAKLIPTFDPEALHADYQAVRRAIQATPAGYPGEGHSGWTSACVYSGPCGASPLLELTPYLRHALFDLHLRLRLVRLLLLEPDGVIREHRDSFLSKRIVRLHLPIVSHPDVEMYLDGHRCVWRPGELWYGDFSLPHSAVNRSGLTRVHLVLDVVADRNLQSLFATVDAPQFLAADREDVAERELDRSVLERFAFDFTLPPGFQLPGLQALPIAAAGCIRCTDNELCVFVNEQPILKAVPVSEDTLDLLGLESDARLVYAFDGPALQSVTLTLDAVPVFRFDVRTIHGRNL